MGREEYSQFVEITEMSPDDEQYGRLQQIQMMTGEQKLLKFSLSLETA